MSPIRSQHIFPACNSAKDDSLLAKCYHNLCSDAHAQEGLGGFIKKYVDWPEVLVVHVVSGVCEEMSKQR